MFGDSVREAFQFFNGIRIKRFISLTNFIDRVLNGHSTFVELVRIGGPTSGFDEIKRLNMGYELARL